VATDHLFKRRKTRAASLALAAALVAVMLVVGAFLAGCGDGDSKQAAQGETQGSTAVGALIDTIIVSGTGKVTTLPDEATIQVAVENDGATAAEALDANSADTQKVLDRLKAEGVADKDIETTGVVVFPNRYYDSQTNQEKTTGYRAQNTVTVTFHDLTVIGDVFAAVTEAGADNVYGPNWLLSDDNTAITEALTKAVANARMKGEALAADQGVKLGEVLVINESSAANWYPIYGGRETASYATDESVKAPPINPENLEVTATVTVTYRMSR
jgi:uncharacterized protein YggE